MATKEHPEVYWDSLGLDRPDSGIGVYGASLLRELAAIEVFPKIVVPNYLEFFPVKQQRLSGEPRFLSKLPARKLWGSEFSFNSINPDLQATRPTIYHGLSNFNLPCIRRPKPQAVRFVLTVHDLIPILAGSSVSRALRLQSRFLLPRALERADSIIAVSNWTSSTLAERFPQHCSKITVIPNGFLYSGAQEYRKRKNQAM